MLKELVLTFFLTIAFLNSVLMMEKLLRLSRLLSGVGATFYDMARLIFFLQPQLLLLTLPMSLLLSSLLVYGRMNMDSEIVILRTSGMNFRKIARPVVILGLLCFLFNLGISFYLGPKGSTRLREEITKIIAMRSTFAIEEGTFNMSFKDLVILVKGKKSSDTLQDIFIYDNRKKEEPRVLVAKEGQVYMQDASTIGLNLNNGYINMTKGKNTTELFFDRYRMTITIDAESPAPKRAEFTPAGLLRKAAVTEDKKEKTLLYLELHRRLSLPFVCILLVFLGPSIALMSGRTGRLGGLAVGLAVFTVYYMLLIYSENIALAGKMPHYIGSWTATAALAVFTVIMFFKEDSV